MGTGWFGDFSSNIIGVTVKVNLNVLTEVRIQEMID